MIKSTAEGNGRRVGISLPQDPAQPGKSQFATLTKMLAGFSVRPSPESGDKFMRCSGFSAQA
ncbi:phage terminase large subunit-like protein [Pseudorhizobium tarimense]|uniref:Phage terminase large subunit-like protein n=2 Tax=Pseudorhizobium tarimense TaxID=1079109 RepID=A0ABV2H5L9_9HYPH